MFVTLEGIDRSGKSTQAGLLARALGPETLLVREPGGTAVGERIRELVKDPELGLTPGTELMLFAAARAELAATVIAPALSEGRDVVCDRYVDSSVAYQGGRAASPEAIERLNDLAVGGVMPDVTLLVRVDPELATARGEERLAGGEPDGADRFEARGEDFQRAVAAAYERILAGDPQRIAAIDGHGSPEEVHARVVEALAERGLGERLGAAG